MSARLLRTFQANDTLALDVTPDLTLMGGRDKTVQLWDNNSGLPVWSREHTGSVYAVSIACDGKRAVAIAGGSNIRTFDLQSGRLINEVTVRPAAHPFKGAPVPRLGLSPSGRLVAFTRSDGVLGVFDSGTGSLLQRCRRSTFDRGVLGRLVYRLGGSNPSERAAITPDDSTLATVRKIGVGQYIVEVYSLNVGKRQAVFSIFRPDELSISCDGQLIAYSHEGVVYLLKLEGGQHIATLSRGREEDGYYPAKAIFCQSTIVTVLESGLVGVWKLSGQKISGLQLDRGCEAHSASASPDGSHLAVWHRHDNSVKVYDLS